MTYKKNHPWLKFELDLRSLNYSVWAMLGECQSKCDHISRVPLQPRTAMALHRLYLAKGALATTAIEGNTLTEEEVLRHFEGQLKLPPSREYLAAEVDNIKKACNLVFAEALDGKLPELSVDRIEQLNKIILDGLQPEGDEVPGMIRRENVVVARYKAPPPDECKFLLQKLCDWLNGSGFFFPLGLEKAGAIIKAIMAHLYLVWIHPFGNGNGRTARMMEFQILTGHGIPAPAAHLLSNHYNQTRNEYYRQLDYASKSGGDVTSFISYAVQGFRDGLIAQLEFIHEQQFRVIWQNYVHEQFIDDDSAAGKRKRDLVLDLSSQRAPVPFAKLTEISPGTAAAYARKTSKTLSRDLRELIDMQLVVKEDSGFRARMELILGFLPSKASL